MTEAQGRLGQERDGRMHTGACVHPLRDVMRHPFRSSRSKTMPISASLSHHIDVRIRHPIPPTGKRWRAGERVSRCRKMGQRLASVHPHPTLLHPHTEIRGKLPTCLPGLFLVPTYKTSGSPAVRLGSWLLRRCYPLPSCLLPSSVSFPV